MNRIFIWFSIALWISGFASFAQRGLILDAATGNVLDPNGDGFVSISPGGFSEDGYYVDEFEIKMYGIPIFEEGEVLFDIQNGAQCGTTDLAVDTTGFAAYAGYDDAGNLIFRFRITGDRPSVEAYTILLDTDQKMGADDPNFTPDNPGFEIDITLIKSAAKGVYVYNIDGIESCPSWDLFYPFSSHYQKSIADVISCEDSDYFLDFYVPFDDLAATYGITEDTELRVFAVTNVSATCAMGGAISDIGGVDDREFDGCNSCAFLSLSEVQCPSSVGNLCSTCGGFNYGFTDKPVIDVPIKAYQDFISGTAEPFAEVYVDIFQFDGILESQDTIMADMDGFWVSMQEGLLHPDDSITVSAKVIGECASDVSRTDLAYAIVIENQPPGFNVDPTVITYIENEGPKNIAPALELLDEDDSTLLGAIVSISELYNPDEDSLVYIDQNGISGNYDPLSGTLNLSGLASITQYRQALRSVSYFNKSEDPSEDTRSVFISARDTIEYGDTVYIDIQVVSVNDPPVITGTPTALGYADLDGAKIIDPGIQITDLDHQDLLGATVWFSNNFFADEDTILFTDQAGIVGSYNSTTGTLSLDGAASLNDYILALQSIQYNNTEINPSPLTREISFRVFDGLDSSNIFSRHIDFTSQNFPPEVIDNEDNPIDTLYESTEEDTPLEICLQYFDPDGDEVTISTGTSLTEHGSINLDSLYRECFEFIPDQDYYGADTLEIINCDDAVPSLCDTLIVIIEIIPVNDPPSVYFNGVPTDTIFLETNEDTILDYCLDARDLENDPLMISSIESQNGQGEYAIDETDPLCFEFSPENNFYGQEVSHMKICEIAENGLCDSIVVVIDVLPVNDPPVIVDKDLIPADTLFFTVSDNVTNALLCFNAVDPEEDAILLTSIESISGHGTGNPITGEGLCLEFSAEESYAGEEFMKVEVCDNGTPSLCDSAILVINILEENDPPQTYQENTPVDTLLVVTMEDTPIDICLDVRDEENDPVSLSEFNSLTENGSYTTEGMEDLCLRFMPDPNYFGVEYGKVIICEDTEDALCDTLIIKIDILPVNDAPVIVNENLEPTDTFSIDMNMNTAYDLCVQAIDIDDEILDLYEAQSGIGQDLINIPDPVDLCFTYTPPLEFSGMDTVTIKVCDQGNPVLCDSAIVLVQVFPVNKPPEIIFEQISADTIFLVTDEDIPLDFCVEVQDENNDQIRLQQITEIDPNGSLESTQEEFCFTYTPDMNFYGLSLWSIKVCDNGLPVLCDSAIIWIDVNPVNDPPMANDDTIKVFRTQKGEGNVLENDSDVEDDELRINTSPESGPLNGTVVLQENGDFEYQADPAFVGTDGFVYTVCDLGNPSECVTGNVVIIVEDVPVTVFQAVSPNGDGLNDYLRIEGIEFFPKNSVRIYDRFNNLVFEILRYDNQSNIWSGQSNKGIGKLDLPEDTYYYVISLGDGSSLLTGYIVLKRE